MIIKVKDLKLLYKIFEEHASNCEIEIITCPEKIDCFNCFLKWLDERGIETARFDKGVYD